MSPSSLMVSLNYLNSFRLYAGDLSASFKVQAAIRNFLIYRIRYLIENSDILIADLD